MFINSYCTLDNLDAEHLIHILIDGIMLLCLMFDFLVLTKVKCTLSFFFMHWRLTLYFSGAYSLYTLETWMGTIVWYNKCISKWINEISVEQRE